MEYSKMYLNRLQLQNTRLAFEVDILKKDFVDFCTSCDDSKSLLQIEAQYVRLKKELGAFQEVVDDSIQQEVRKDIAAEKKALEEEEHKKKTEKAAEKNKTPDSNQFLTRKQLCKICAISNSTLYRLIEKCDFPSGVHFASRGTRWKWADIEAWYEASKKRQEEREANAKKQ